MSSDFRKDECHFPFVKLVANKVNHLCLCPVAFEQIIFLTHLPTSQFSQTVRVLYFTDQLSPFVSVLCDGLPILSYSDEINENFYRVAYFKN
jgi:hypothetical protein